MNVPPLPSTHCLEIRTVQAVAFKVLVEALKDLLTDTCIEFDATGMKIVALDTSHVVLVHLKLDASKFELYHCEGRISIGVNMMDLHKLIKTINNNNTLTLYIDNDNMNNLCIRIDNSEKNSRTTYKLHLLDLNHQDIWADATDFTEVVTLASSDFQKICRDMQNLSEFMEIKSLNGNQVKKNQIIFSCTGDFCSQETIITDNESSNTAAADGENMADDDADPASHGSKIVQGVFSIKYLVLFTKCTNLCNTVELYLKNDYPLIIKYDVASLGSIKLALAPQQQHAGFT